MSEHFFGLGRGEVPDELAEQVEQIAARHDASFVRYDDPAEGPRFWFSCQNLGHPFDKATADAVKADLEAAGLADELWPPRS